MEGVIVIEIAPVTLQERVLDSPALIEAGLWMDRPHNREAAARILCDRVFRDVPLQLMVEVLSGRLATRPGEPVQATRPMRFHVAGASCPVSDHAAWWFRQMQLWGHVPADMHVAPMARIWRPRLWLQAVGRLQAETEEIETFPAWIAHEAEGAGTGAGARTGLLPMPAERRPEQRYHDRARHRI